MERRVMLVLASTRTDIASYVSALFWVYILLIFVYLLINMMFSMGVRPPYSRWTDAILGFLRDVSEPYLRLFRRFIPPLGMFDFSPIVAIFVLYVVSSLVVSLIHG
jgi:YggT family protein